MGIMNGVIKEPRPSAPKGIIYGPPGVGKTTFGANAEASIILDLENGAGSINCQRTPYLETWSAAETWLEGVEKDDHQYKVLVVDSLDWLIRRIEEQVSGAVNSGSIASTLNKSHGGYGNGKQVMKNYIHRILLPQFDRIITRGIAIVLLGHAKRTDITDVDGITIEKTAPDISDDYLNTFVEWSDFVCLAKCDIDGNRTLSTTESNRALAKNRYSMPGEIGFTWDNFTGAIGAGLSEKF